MINLANAPRHFLTILPILLVTLGLCGCAPSQEQIKRSTQTRQKYIDTNANLSETTKTAIADGIIREGMTIGDLQAILSSSGCALEAHLILRGKEMEMLVPLSHYMRQRGIKDEYQDPVTRLESIRRVPPEIPLLIRLHGCNMSIEGREFILKDDQVIVVK